MIKRFSVLLLMGALLAGCVTGGGTPPASDGATYDQVFRGRWWSYYERGCFYLAHESPEEAAADFRMAIAGRSRDSWRARTYGLHFVEYFPNRELAAALYELGRLDEADSYLERSMAQIDTERGYHLRDQIVRERIARGLIEDKAPPVITASFTSAPGEGAMLADRQLTLRIDARDDTGVARVTVDGAVLHQRGSAESLTFEREMLLEEGVFTVEVTATDLADKTITETVPVTVDLTGPTLGIFSPLDAAVTSADSVLLQGVAADKNGVVHVELDGRPLAESPGAPRLEFAADLPLRDGPNAFVIAARDSAGNETRTAIQVYKGDPASRAAALWRLRQTAPEKLHLAQAAPENLDNVTGAAHETGGEIRIKAPSLDRPYRHNRALLISGDVVTQSKVAALSINGQPFEPLTGAPKESFQRRIPLNEGDIPPEGGTVAVAIHAEDGDGNPLDKSVSVQVQPIMLDDPAYQMPVAVLAFAGPPTETEIPGFLRAKTESQLVSQKRFNVLERIALQDILTEQQLSAALSDPDQALTLGKLTPAQVFLTAEVYPRGENGIEVLARVIDTETSSILENLDVFIEDRRDNAAIDRACLGLANRLRETFPRLSGEVLRVRESGGTQEMMLNWTTEDGIRKGTRVVLVHQEPDEVDPATGEVVWPGDIHPIGKAVIVNVISSGAQARSTEFEEEGIKVEEGMPAITL
jgi:tetratricopeptide (TPR) repeat protein